MKLYDCVEGENYRNPLLCMDYSDPDVIRVGEDYYMVASSFTYLPGVPLLHSHDLVHWEQLAWCVQRLPFARYDLPAHGCGTWAPAIRWHEGTFYVFIPLPDEGIFVTTATDPCGPWSELHCIKQTCGWIDPCPFWDEDGSAYMAHAYAKSRCGIKHRIDVCRMAPDAASLLDEGVEVYNNELLHPTMEGPKFYKRNGWYYIFAPAGGVGTGWQTVLRSKSPLGPYEAKIVLHQGDTKTNGPHQGAWVQTPEGRDWFFHFQDAGVYGRILHLQPMCWVEDWPFIGQEQNGDGIGEPVERWPLPLPGQATDHALWHDDDFSGCTLGIQWQWQANPQTSWYALQNGLRLFMPPCARGQSLLWYLPNVLTQLPQARQFTMSAALTLCPEQEGDEAGIAVMGHDYSALVLHKTNSGMELRLYRGEVTQRTAEGVAREILYAAVPLPQNCTAAELTLHFEEGGGVRYSYRLPDEAEKALPGRFAAAKSTWSGAKPALFARNITNAVTAGSGLFANVTFKK